MPWIQLQIPADSGNADQLEDLLMEMGAEAVSMEDGADQPLYEPVPGTTPLWSDTHVIGLFDAERNIDQICAELRSAWHQRTQQELPEIEVTLVEDKDWERAWMDDFKPMRFGQRLWIVPSWHEAPDPEAVNLLLDPGLAFGTGTHPTTALCLEWLDGQPLQDLQVIDFGCGSGILAIAALLLGAARVTATDIDPQALEASRDNAQRNQLADERLPLYLPADMPSEPADLLVANILAGPLVTLAPQLTALVKPGGRIALSGILAEQTDEILAAYDADFELDPVANKDGWIRVSGVRRDVAP